MITQTYKVSAHSLRVDWLSQVFLVHLVLHVTSDYVTLSHFHYITFNQQPIRS